MGTYRAKSASISIKTDSGWTPTDGGNVHLHAQAEASPHLEVSGALGSVPLSGTLHAEWASDIPFEAFAGQSGPLHWREVVPGDWLARACARVDGLRRRLCERYGWRLPHTPMLGAWYWHGWDSYAAMRTASGSSASMRIEFDTVPTITHLRLPHYMTPSEAQAWEDARP